MIHHPAEIDQTGLERLVLLGEQAGELGSDPVLGSFYMPLDQMYIPGISVPDVSGLEKPFWVPLIGDDESFGVSVVHVDCPQKRDAPYWKQISFVGTIPAESFWYNAPTEDEELFEGQPVELNEVINEFLDTGGFLRAVARLVPVGDYMNTEGIAEFYLFEGEAEYEQISQLLESGVATPAEIVASVRLPDLGIRLSSQTD